ncbi:MAG: helix-turn-helix transcriptional regulator, partial [Elusimicrobiota bacterium]
MKNKKLLFNDWLKTELKNKEFKKAFDSEDIRARLALLIAEKRHKLGMSQAELARRIHTKQQVVSDIETLKHSNITVLTLNKIAKALNSHLTIS